MGTNERNIKQLHKEFCELSGSTDEESRPDLCIDELNQIRVLIENELAEKEHRKGTISERERFFETLWNAALYAFSAGYMTAYKERTESAKDRPCEDCGNHRSANG